MLESLHLVSRVAKNQYSWHGRHSLPKTLRNLQRLGEKQRYEEQMAHLQQKELNLIDHKVGERRRDGCPDSQDPQLLDFPEPDCPSCESPGPTPVSSEDGEGQMGHPGGMWPPGLPHEDGQTDGSHLGCPLHLTGNLCSGGLTWYLVCLDHRWRMAFQFQTDSPTLLPLCEPLRKIYLERISVFKRFYLFNCILEWMT